MVDGRLRVIAGEVASVVETSDPERFQAECVEAFVASWTARGFAASPFVVPPKSWRVSYAASGVVSDSLIS